MFKIQHYYLFPSILFFCCIGTYSISNDINHIYVTAFFGVVGYIFAHLGLEAAPLMLGFILGPMFEEHFTRQITIGQGDLTTFVERPLSMALFVTIVGILVYNLAKFIRKK